jgi:UDP-N-acetylmuramate dehydrogenase
MKRLDLKEGHMVKALEGIQDLVIHYDEPLARFTAARLGGPADILALAYTQEALLQAVLRAHYEALPWIILGAGANVLISDRGVRGLVIINETHQTIIDTATGHVRADSGVTLITLARRCIHHGLKGFEWAVSVPGSVGGAIVNNAGAHGGDIAHNLYSAHILDLQKSNEAETWPVERLAYDYRYSILKGQRSRYVILEAMLQLEPGHNPTALAKTADEFVAYRKRTQPPGASLGSMFKNPLGHYAGRLIEAAGLKGYRIGGVQVSPVHANFFINISHGTAADYDALITYTQATVAEKLGIQLELEIERIGEGFE